MCHIFELFILLMILISLKKSIRTREFISFRNLNECGPGQTNIMLIVNNFWRSGRKNRSKATCKIDLLKKPIRR